VDAELDVKRADAPSFVQLSAALDRLQAVGLPAVSPDPDCYVVDGPSIQCCEHRLTAFPLAQHRAAL
jgi:hypothetical protein